MPALALKGATVARSTSMGWPRAARVPNVPVQALARPSAPTPKQGPSKPRTSLPASQNISKQHAAGAVPQATTQQTPATRVGSTALQPPFLSLPSSLALPSLPSLSTLSLPSPLIKLPHNLRRRLFTHIDFLHLHATTAALTMFHGTFHFVRVLYEVAAHGRFPSPEAHWVFALVIILNTTRDLTGLILALQNRKGVVQRVFVAGAISSLSFMLMLWYQDTYFLTAEQGCKWASDLVRITLCVTTVAMLWLGVGDVTVNAHELVGARDEKPAHRGAHHTALQDAHHDEPTAASPTVTSAVAPAATADAATDTSTAQPGAAAVARKPDYAAMVCYYLPVAIPTWLAALGGALVVFGGDDLRTYAMEHWPHYRELIWSLVVVGVVGGAIGSFATTLRDRYLITRQQEMMMVGIPFYCFLGVTVLSLVTYEDAWDLMRVAYDPVFVHQVISMLHNTAQSA